MAANIPYLTHAKSD